MRARSRVLVFALVLLATIAVCFSRVGIAHNPVGPVAEKSLDIERNPKEPLEMVDIKVSAQSLRSKIGVKLRRGDIGMDTVRFQDTDDWFRRVTVKMRNVSTKPIIDMRAYLYFKPPTSQTLYCVDLTPSRHLQSEALEPGAEFDLTVSDKSWSQTADILLQYGVDANLSSVTLTIEVVTFSDHLMWHAGHLSRVDPNNPDRSVPVDEAPPGSPID